MLTPVKHSAARLTAAVRKIASLSWGGIGCRVAFIMSLAIVLVSVLVGFFLLSEGKQAQQRALRSRAYDLGSFFSSFAIDDIVSANTSELTRKLLPLFPAEERFPDERDLIYLIVYDRTGEVLVATSPAGIITAGKGAGGPTRGDAGDERLRAPLDAAAFLGAEPHYQHTAEGSVHLTLPVFAGGVRVGFLGVGIADHGFQTLSSALFRKAFMIVTAILLLGLVFSQVIAAGITKPIARLSAAVDELGRQNWRTPLPIRGRDELSQLANAFNQMALTLRRRETSLSRGNRDLFILHTAGLDLMEGLDLDSLLRKIAARAEDLVKADTIAVATVDRTTRALRYLEVTGSKESILRDLDLPLESGGIYNWIVSYGTPLLIEDARSDYRLDAEQMRSLGITTIITVPLWTSSTMMSILTAVNKQGGGAFDKHDLQLLTVFSNLAGAALQNSFLYNDLKQSMEELKSTQKQLVHSTKMAAIGELAANVAHEINNPLTSVLGYTGHLLKTLEVPEDARQKLRMMEQETLRVRKIIRNLLDFTRQGMDQRRSGDLLQPLREMVSLLQGAAKAAAVRIDEDYPPLPVTVEMDPNEIKQVFINIMNNALHAMPQGGTLTIRVEQRGDHETVVEFSDTGHGIPREHLEKVFEPFFSTKGYGDGTGLGLSISYRIVQNHGGRIEVESEVGRGSRFRVLLPLHKRPDLKESRRYASA